MLCTHSILQVTMKRTLKQKKSFQIHVGSTLYMIEEKCWSAAVNGHKIIIGWEHGLAGQSCTDVSITWGKGTDTNNNQEKVINIDFCRPSKSSNPVTEVNNNAPHPVVHMRFKKLETHNDLTTFVASSNIADLWNCPNTMLNRIVTAKREPDSVCQSEHTHSSHDLKLHRWYSIHQL